MPVLEFSPNKTTKSSSSSSTSSGSSSGSLFHRQSARLRALLTRQMSTPEMAMNSKATTAAPPTSPPGSPPHRASGHRCSGLFKRPFLLCLLVTIILVTLACTAEGQVFGEDFDDCNQGPMRKPPRFGKRSMRKPPRFGKRSNSVLEPASDVLAIDPATWPDVLARVRRSECIRGAIRRRTMRGLAKMLASGRRFLKPEMSSGVVAEPMVLEIVTEAPVRDPKAELIARLRARFPKEFKSLEKVVKTFQSRSMGRGGGSSGGSGDFSQKNEDPTET